MQKLFLLTSIWCLSTACALAATDTIRLAGTVVGADGKPQPHMTVVSLEGGTEARVTTRADGTFTLEHITRGHATLLAVCATAAGIWTGQTDAPGVTIATHPLHTTAADAAVMEKTLLQLWERHGCPDRLAMARLFLKDGPEQALKILTLGGGTITDEMRGALLQMYADQYPDQAAPCIPDQLDRIYTERDKFYTAVGVGVDVAKMAPMIGEHCYEIAGNLVNHGENLYMQCDRYSRLVELAHLLGHADDVRAIMAHITPIARTLDDDARLFSVVQGAAKVSPELAQAVWDGLPDEKRDLAIAQAIPLIARYNPLAADGLKAALVKENYPDIPPDVPMDPAALNALAKHDPAAALATAEVSDDAQRLSALTAVVAAQPKAIALRVCQEIFARGAQTSDPMLVVELAKAARYAYGLDPACGSALFTRLNALITGERFDEDTRGKLRLIYAYYAAPLDPVESRITIERSYALFEQSEDPSVQSMAQICPPAMLPLDAHRALAMANAIAGQAQAYGPNAIRGMLHYLRGDEKERIWGMFGNQ